MRRLAAALILASVVSGLLIVVEAGASLASWVSQNCYISNYDDDHYRRIDARAYAYVGVEEGYEWGGGCWNNNDIDDTPGQPDSGGEGPDCSGFTFKTWELKATWGRSGFQYWNRIQNMHGPYAAASYHDAASNLPFYNLINKSRDTTLYMDAFASSAHIGMIYSDTVPSGGGDYIIEAKGDTYGMGIWTRDYRGDSSYSGVRRRAWTPDCYPRCGAPSSPEAVVVR
jgi:hypothetical protein